MDVTQLMRTTQKHSVEWMKDDPLLGTMTAECKNSHSLVQRGRALRLKVEIRHLYWASLFEVVTQTC